MKYRNVSIIGGGKVGCVLGRKLNDKKYNILSVISRSFASAAFCADFLDCQNFSISIEDISAETDLILIAVNDNSIKDVVNELKNLNHINFKNTAVFHTSGALGSVLLFPLKLKGAKVFSIHPFQTFMSISSVLEHMDGVYYGIEGLKSSLKIASKIVKDLNGMAIEIPANLKPVYHTAGVFASNYLIALIENVNLILSKLNIPQSEFISVLNPIIKQTISNISVNPSYESLTGPIVRGDSDIVELHLKSLARELPILLRFYISMGLETLEASKHAGKIDQYQYNRILKLFVDFLKSESYKEEMNA